MASTSASPNSGARAPVCENAAPDPSSNQPERISSPLFIARLLTYLRGTSLSAAQFDREPELVLHVHIQGTLGRIASEHPFATECLESLYHLYAVGDRERDRLHCIAEFLKVIVVRGWTADRLEVQKRQIASLDSGELESRTPVAGKLRRERRGDRANLRY